MGVQKSTAHPPMCDPHGVTALRPVGDEGVREVWGGVVTVSWSRMREKVRLLVCACGLWMAD